VNYYESEIMGREHRNDLFREVEQEYLAKLALQGQCRRDSVFGRALLILGRRLVALGARLEEKHGGAADLPALGSAGSRPA
jgi:hypothetical protein